MNILSQIMMLIISVIHSLQYSLLHTKSIWEEK